VPCPSQTPHHVGLAAGEDPLWPSRGFLPGDFAFLAERSVGLASATWPIRETGLVSGDVFAENLHSCSRRLLEIPSVIQLAVIKPFCGRRALAEGPYVQRNVEKRDPLVWRCRGERASRRQLGPAPGPALAMNSGPTIGID
jgi:hypothetical protein